jgi:hypothetical protein
MGFVRGLKTVEGDMEAAYKALLYLPLVNLIAGCYNLGGNAKVKL